MSRAPEGAEVGIYLDMIARVRVGDVLQTKTGRRYGIVKVRVQQRGAHRGRQHLRCLILGADADLAPQTRVFEIYWHPRGRGRRRA